MAITSSAKKALRVSRHKRVFNVRRISGLKEAVNNVQKLIVLKKKNEAVKLLPLAYKAIDKASKIHTIDKNTASRKKSRLARRVAKMA